MTAINASRDMLNYSDLLAFVYRCDKMNLLDPVACILRLSQLWGGGGGDFITHTENNVKII